MTKNPRTLASRALTKIIVGHSLKNLTLEDEVESLLTEQRATLHELVYGVLRHSPSLDGLARQILKKPFKKKDQDLRSLLWLGLYELEYLRTPDYAAVSAYVELCSTLGKKWAGRLINGCLRRYIRERTTLRNNLTVNEQHNLPFWLWDEISHQWPEQLLPFCEAAASRPPLTLRVNQRRKTRNEVLYLFSKAKISAEPVGEFGVKLSKSRPISSIPGFHEGFFSVQDEAAQAAATLLAPIPNERILDVCAAPGGKTCHLAEYQPNLKELIAVDMHRERLAKVISNRERLGLYFEVIQADASKISESLGKDLFDAILLDAPCSATGVIRRNPDIKQRRQLKDIARFSSLQLQMLAECWKILKPGGRLLYATCSVLNQENDDVIAHFKAQQSDAMSFVISSKGAAMTKEGLQFMPRPSGHDGLYYAMLKKSAENLHTETMV